MFQLPTKASSINGRLETFDGLSSVLYRKIDPTTAVSSSNFSQQNVSFRFSCGGNEWWIPSQTFLRIRVKLSKANGATLADADNIAPNMGLCANLWQNAHFKIGNTIVSRIDSHMAQIDAVYNRLHKTGSYLKGMGQSLNFWESTHAERKANLVATRAVNEFELIWTPPLSIFHINHNLPSGEYELSLTPKSLNEIYKSVIESRVDAVHGTAFRFSVEDVTLYVPYVNGPVSANSKYILDLYESRCQIGQISSSTSTQQQNFEVSPNTASLTVALQDNRVGTNSIYSPTKFRIDAKEDVLTGKELLMTRLFVNYANQVKPVSGDVSFEFKTGKDYLVQRYYDNLINSGLSFHGDVETLQEYVNRGPLYHFSWPRDGRNNDTRAQVNFQMSADSSQGNLLLFDYFQRVFQITVKNSRVRSVMEG